ncbi:MAG: putative MFS family arabinose efflux permease [Sphingobacteriales bacterium]|jgi:predicted MFS family arabinose efflux permease
MITKKLESTIVWLLAAINFTHVLDFMIIMPLGPQLKRIFDLNPQEWSLLVSSYPFAAFFASLGAIFVIDKIGRKKMLLLAFGGFIISTFLMALAPTFGLLLGARIIAGMFGGTTGTLLLTIVGDVVPLERRGTAMGKIMAGFSGAAALGVPFGIYFGTFYGWQMPFYTTGIISIFIFILAIFKIPSLKEHLLEKNPIRVPAAIKLIFKDKNITKSFLFLALLIFGQFTILPFLSPYMVSNVGFREEQLTYIYLFGGLLTVFSGPLIGKLGDKKGNTNIFIIWALISLIPIFLITRLGVAPIYYAITLTTLLFIFVGGRMIPALAIIISTAAPEIRGVFMGIRAAVQQLAAGIAAYVAGLIMIENADGTYGNYEIVGLMAVGFSILSILIVKRIKIKY